MVLKRLESFDDGATTLRLPTLDPAAIDTAYGKDGYGARLGDSSNYYFTAGVANPSIMGFHFRIISATGTKKLVNFASSQLHDFGKLSYDAGGENLEFEFFNGAVGHQYAYTPAGSVPTNVWHHVELRVFQSTGSASTLDWTLNGGPVTDTITNGDMLAVSTIAFFGGTTSEMVEAWDIDNLYICDTTGTVNNAFLGPTRADDLYPNGVGNYSNLTPSVAKANYETVDENPPDGVEYVYSATEGDEDTYLMNDTAGTEAVSGVISNIVAKKTDAGAKFVRPLVRIGGVDYTGTSNALTEVYSIATSVWDESPATSSAWTTSEIDGMEVGPEVRDS